MSVTSHCQVERAITAPRPPLRSAGSPNRGLHLAATHRLQELLVRYEGYRARLEADRSVWPPPVNAREHVDDVIAEIGAVLAAREAVAA